MRKPIALILGDLHLRGTAPTGRPEPDWLAAQQRYLDEIERLCSRYDVPAVIAGDVFDTWRPGPAVIAQAIRWATKLPGLYAVPGQHDLPEHRYERRSDTAYGCLVAAGVLTDLLPGAVVNINGVGFVGWPWGMTPEPRAGGQVAICHRYIWRDKATGYPGADPDKRATKYAGGLRGYAAAFFGDNHKRFTARIGETWVVNCGYSQPLTRPEAVRPPCVYLLGPDLRAERLDLDASADLWTDGPDPHTGRPPGGVTYALAGLMPADLDFRRTIEQRLDEPDVTPATRLIVTRAMDGEVCVDTNTD